MEIVDYTEKSLVIKGEKTREYKENLKELGGKFNASLKCGAGWIFPKTKKAELEALVAKVDKGEINPIVGKVYTSIKPEEKKTGYQTKYEKPQNIEKINNEDVYQFILKLESQIDAMKLEIGKWKQSLKKDVIKDQENKQINDKQIEVEYEEEIIEVESEEEEKVKHPRRLLK